MKSAVYTGSFDPVTLGHLNVIQRSSRLVDHLIIGIGINSEKRGLFEPQERLELVQRVTSDLSNVEVKTFQGLAILLNDHYELIHNHMHKNGAALLQNL